ncbi:MAG TPA: CAP domain-containing protein [Dehalococcoidia bacterium]|nr:CAP domain-containing protein [Dehalococcoidia bacterium]
MSPRSLGRLLLLAPLLLAGCGVPISAADLALTPEPEPTSAVDVRLGGQSLPSARSADGAPASASRLAATAGPLTTPVPFTPLATSTARATGTAQASATPSATPSPTPFGTPAPTATPPPSAAGLAEEAVRLINAYRTSSGRPALNADPALMAAAAAYARQMAEANWLACGCDFHTGPDGSQPEGRIARAGYPGRFRGEAITGGQGDAQSAVNAWLVSPPHAAIVLDTSATDIGIGYFYSASAAYGHFWVLIVGAR